MEVLNNVSLKNYNTFGLDVKAAFFTLAENPAQLQEVLATDAYGGMPLLLLGGGSNILFTRDFNGLVVKVGFRGVKHEMHETGKVLVTAGAGENWDKLVQHCVEQGWGGLENLSLIPGTVGASPIQNIGAYGVEITDVFSHLSAIELKTYEERIFNHKDCRFAYRSSIFKNELRGKYLISYVSFLLSTNSEPNLSYAALRQEFEKSGEIPGIRSVADAVIRIRRSKLPDPDELGNAGSFFKNPEIDQKAFDHLLNHNPALPFHLQKNGRFKIPAAWLIEQCGWKGYRNGDAGVHKLQPLVLVNYGSASGIEILELAKRIMGSVSERFGITLEPEVNIL